MSMKTRTSHNNVTDLNTEGGRDVHRKVLVTALVAVVLRHVVQVLPADDHRTSHLRRDDLAAQKTATNRDETGPGALLVYFVSILCSGARVA